MSDDQCEPYCSNCGRAGRHCAACDDQDTTAPGRVALDIVYEHSLGTLREHRWCRWLAGNIYTAALEEMRVRAALKRAGMDENGMVHITTTLVSKPGGDRCGYCGAACDHYD